MTDPATTLRNALPADPANDGPVGVDSTALRQVLNELHTHRLDEDLKRLADVFHAIEWWDSCDWGEDRARDAVEAYRASAPRDAGVPSYRTGRRNGHCIYWQDGDDPHDDDRFIGSAVTVADAARLVDRANRHLFDHKENSE